MFISLKIVFKIMFKKVVRNKIEKKNLIEKKLFLPSTVY
jgi:hypothetical protein